MERLVLKIKYGGLGDHLLYSPLPRIAKEEYNYDEVCISNYSVYNNPNTKRLVWDLNPFVDGYVDEDGPYPQFGSVPEGKNLLDGVADFFGLGDGSERFREPELYYESKLIPELKNAVIFEPNHSNNKGIPSRTAVRLYLQNKGITHQMKLLHEGSNVTQVKIIDAPELEHFCDIIHSCKAFYCFTSGCATLSAALGKSTTILYTDGILPMFHHSKLHTYVRL